INGGFFVFDSKRIWDYLDDNEMLSFEREPLQSMAKDGELMMFPHDEFWQPMDTYREYLLLNNLWNERKEKGKSLWPGQISQTE
ncbi:MAG: glucose-1-phosphate cytidylyltransferase, partial [Candidatus Kariarchaeaceae archaeon]